MSLLIRPCHHHRFGAVLNDSLRLRRDAFREQPDCVFPDPGRAAHSGVDDDGLDGDAAFHLVTLNAAVRAIATVRITPTASPHLSCDRLAGRMGLVMPRGPHVVELSLMCADPLLSREERREVMLELRACIALLFLKQGWTHGIGVGHDRDIQPFIRSGMAVQVLGPPFVLPGDSQLSYAVLATDPDRPQRLVELLAAGPPRLEDPDEDPSLFTRYGDRAVA